MRSTPAPETFLANLTDAQREAVLHTEGPLLILAGPGSGKTRVITCRVGNLIQRHEPVAVTTPAAQAVRQCDQDVVPPGPQKVVLDVHLQESGLSHSDRLRPATRY